MSKISIDKSILLKAKRGDTHAFEQIIAECEGPIFNFILRMVTRREDAEDLTQDTFIKLYDHMDKFDPEKKFSAWLFTIANRTVYDWLRKKRVRKESYIIDDEENPFETIDTKTSYKNIEMSIDIDRGLSKLRQEYKTALLLFYWQELSYNQIGEVMEVPANTVKTYLSRGKQELKKAMKEDN